MFNHPISIIQGSKSGPFWYNLFVNDLPKITTLLSVLFADDANFLCANKNPELLCKQVNEEMAKIIDYFNSNGLSVSIEKTTYMIFTPKNKKQIKMDIKIGNVSLSESEEITFLGISFNNKLNFSSHFKKIYSKIKRGLNGLIMVKNQLSTKAKLCVYHALIHSHLNYCSLIWISSITKKQLKQLKTTQKKALRIIFSVKYNGHTSSLFEQSKITKVENIFEKESLILTYKYQNKILPPAIQDLFDKSLYDKSIMTRHLTSCILRPKRELKNGDLMYEIIDSWNRIGSSARNEKTLKSFKKKIISMQNRYVDCNKVNCYSCGFPSPPSQPPSLPPLPLLPLPPSLLLSPLPGPSSACQTTT